MGKGWVKEDGRGEERERGRRGKRERKRERIGVWGHGLMRTGSVIMVQGLLGIGDEKRGRGRGRGLGSGVTD